MRRPLIAAAIAVTALAATVAGGVAHAHHPVISVSTDCGDDGWTATYTVAADDDRLGVNWSVNGLPSQPDEIPFVFVESFGYDVASDSFTAATTWSNDADPVSATATSERPEGCEEPEVPTTTAAPTTTTTLPAAEPTTTTASPTTTPPTCVPLPSEPRDGDGDGLVLDGTAGERPIRTTCDPVNPPVTTPPPVVTDPPEAPSPTDPEVTEFRLPATR